MRLTKILPSYGRIVVKRQPASEMTATGRLYIPPQARGQESASVGEVVAVSPAEYNPNIDIDEPQSRFAVGAIVIFGKYTGTEVQIDREAYVIMNEGDILGELVDETGTEAASQ